MVAKTNRRNVIEMPAIIKQTRDQYAMLVSKFPLKAIRSDAQHDRALKLYRGLVLGQTASDKGTRDYAAALATLIESYERTKTEWAPKTTLNARELIRFAMGENELSVSALAREIGAGQSNLSEMLSGHRDWSKAAIKGLMTRFKLHPAIFFAE